MFRNSSRWCRSFLALTTFCMFAAPVFAQTDGTLIRRLPRRPALAQAEPAATPFIPESNLQPVTLEGRDAATKPESNNPFADTAVESAPKAETPSVALPRPIDDEQQPKAARVPAAASAISTEPIVDPVAAAARIEAILDLATTIEANETPIRDVLSEVAKNSFGIPIVLDTKALEEAAIAADVSITTSLKGIPLRQALETVLEPLELTYVVDKHLLKITTKEKAASQITAHVYHLNGFAANPEQARDLVSLLQNSLREQLTAEDGEASIQTFGTAAVVRANYHGHRAVKELLSELANAP